MRKKLIRKGQLGLTIVNPSKLLHEKDMQGMQRIVPMQQAANSGIGGLQGLGKNVLGSLGGVSGIANMGSAMFAGMLNKNNDLIDPVASATQNAIYTGLSTLGPKGQMAAAALQALDAVGNKVTLKEAGVDRFGRKIASQQGAISPTQIIGNTVSNIRDLIKGKTDLREFGAQMARLTPAGFFLGATRGEKAAAREGQTYRDLRKQAEEEIRQNRITAQQLSQERFKDQQTAGWGSLYAKKGGKLPQKCGCSKDKDGLDTDVFYAMPKSLFVKVLRRVNLPDDTPYNDRIKVLIKHSVPKGSNLRSFIEAIGEDISQFIKAWENEKFKV